MQTFTITTKKSIMTFMHESDYNTYMDFISNGLKVVRKAYNTYHFNDGSRFLDVPARNEYKAVRVLTVRNSQYTNEKYFKKHLQAISEYNK